MFEQKPSVQSKREKEREQERKRNIQIHTVTLGGETDCRGRGKDATNSFYLRNSIKIKVLT